MQVTTLNYPPLSRAHVEGARLFADRCDLISSLKVAENSVIAEVGVARGDFSEFLIQEINPRRFVAFDIFTMHEVPVIWGIQSKEFFQGMTQLDYYRRRFARLENRLMIEVGPSRVTLAKQEPESFDLIYIDARHDYEGVKSDAALSARILKREGYLVFNDYIMTDHVTGAPYGVVPAVNELIVNHGWRVVGLGLQRHMFCDIALRRDR